MKMGIKALVAVVCGLFLFIGIAIGFLIAPIKRGVYFGSNNGNRYGSGEDLWDESWDEEDWYPKEKTE